MIEFKQLAEREDAPPDVEVTTDDREGELAIMTECFEESDAEDMVAAQNLKQTRLEGGSLTFTIPGEEAGEVQEIFWGNDDLGRAFEEFIDERNREMIAARGHKIDEDA
jgi:hypothetical protein